MHSSMDHSEEFPGADLSPLVTHEIVTPERVGFALGLLVRGLLWWSSACPAGAEPTPDEVRAALNRITTGKFNRRDSELFHRQ